MSLASVIVRAPRLTRNLRLPVAPRNTRSVTRQRSGVWRLAKATDAPTPVRLSRLRVQPRPRSTVRRTSREGGGGLVEAGGAVAAPEALQAGGVPVCPAGHVAAGVVQLGGVPV